MSSFSLRIPDDLMEEAKKLASENSASLNQFFLVTIAAKIGEAKTRKYFEERPQLADIDAVRAILPRVPGKSSEDVA